MSQKIKKLFSSISPTYDLLNHALSFNLDQRWRNKAVRTLNVPTSTPLKVLDLCAGTMDFSLALLQHYPKAIVYAADFSFEMLISGKRKIQKWEQQLFPLVADALCLPFPPASFDVVLCGYGFRNLDSLHEGLAEIHRVLKPGGQVLILEFFRPQKIRTKLFHHTYGKLLLPTLGKWISKSPDAYNYLHDSISKFLTIQECRQLFEAHGFQSIQVLSFLFEVSSLLMGRKSK